MSEIPFGLRAKREWIREAKHNTKRKVYCFALKYLHYNHQTHDGNIHMLKITITNFQHNTDKRPFVILTEQEDSMPFCPVQAMLDYCKLRGTQAGPLFRHSDTSPIKVGQFNTELHRCLSFCGLVTSRYKGHCFRIGAVCHAAEKGFSDAQIRTLGCWKSDAFKLYVNRSDTLHAN